MPPFIAARTVDDDGKDGDDNDDDDFKHVGKVRLCSDILDTLWHRAEISINQVRAIFMFTSAILRHLHLQVGLQTDQGVFSNIKNYLTTRLQKGIVTPEMQEYLHKTRLYYHEVVGKSNEHEHITDIHRSRPIHLKGELMGFTKGMFNLLPPGYSIEFKFTKANDRFYLIKTDANDDREYKVEIISAFMHLARVQLSEQAKEAFMARWKRETIYYMPYKRTDVRCIMNE